MRQRKAYRWIARSRHQKKKKKKKKISGDKNSEGAEESSAKKGGGKHKCVKDDTSSFSKVPFFHCTTCRL